MTRRFHAPLALFAAILLAPCVVSRAGAQRLEFADSLVFSADSLVKGVEVGIRNAGPAAVTITAGRVDSVRSSSGGAEPTLRVAVRGNVGVPANSPATVLLRGDPAWLKAKPGRYAATLTLAFAGGSLRRRLVVVRAGAPVAPLVGTLKLRPGRGMPWGPFGEEVQVPVRGDLPPPPPGFFPLTTTDGLPVLAEVMPAVAWKENPRVRAYPVRLTGLRGGHAYTGELHFAPGEETSRVVLDVDASDHLVWVLLTVALGVVAGLLFRQWRDVGQPVSYLREREFRLGERFGAALREYAAAGGAAAPLEAQLGEVRRALETRLRGVGRLLTKDAAATAGLEALGKELDALEAQADRVRELARARAQLRSTIAAALQIAGARPEGGGLDERPRVVLDAEEALEGEVSLDSLPGQRETLAAKDALLRSWGDVFHELGREQAWLDALRQGATPEELQKLAAAATDLRKARWDLWDVKGDAELKARDPGATLEKVEASLYEIEDARVSRKAADGAERARLESLRPAMSAARDAWIAREGEVPVADRPVPQQTEAADRVRHVRAMTNVALGIASFIVALVVMLATKYLNHPFGTPQDYATALAWGFGTTAGLDLLASGLASLQPWLTRITPR